MLEDEGQPHMAVPKMDIAIPGYKDYISALAPTLPLAQICKGKTGGEVRDSCPTISPKNTR
jgi:hypothetical protein